MPTIQLLIVCVTVLLIVLVSASHISAPVPPDVFAGLAVGQEVAVHIGDGISVRGGVVRHEPACLMLGSAVLISGGSETKLGGTIRIPSGEVALLQEL
jgi:hypothetical protein